MGVDIEALVPGEARQAHQYLKRLPSQADLQGCFHGHLIRRRGHPAFPISPDGNLSYGFDHQVIIGNGFLILLSGNSWARVAAKGDNAGSPLTG